MTMINSILWKLFQRQLYIRWTASNPKWYSESNAYSGQEIKRHLKLRRKPQLRLKR